MPTLLPTAALTSVSALGVAAGAGPAYVATPRGLYRSANSTFSRWEQMNEVTGITSLSPNPQIPNDLLYSIDNSIFRSIDGGRTATQTSGCNLNDLARAPAAPTVLYATTSAYKYKDCPFVTNLYQAILRSVDDGRTWSAAYRPDGPYEEGSSLGQVAVDAAGSGHVVVAFYLDMNNRPYTIQTRGPGRPWALGQGAPIAYGSPAAIIFDPVRPNSLWISWEAGCTGELDHNGAPVAADLFSIQGPDELAFDPVSDRLYVGDLFCQGDQYTGYTQIYTVAGSTGAHLTVGKLIPNPGNGFQHLAVTANGYLLSGGAKSPLAVLKLNGPGIWSRASFLSASAGQLGSPISPLTVCRGSPCQYFEKGALLKGGSPLPLAADLLTASAAASLPVGGTTSTITYADLAKLESTRTPPPAGFQHGVQVGTPGTFVPFSAQLTTAPGYIVPSFFWRFLTDAHSAPGGWLHDIGLPVTPAVQATVTKGALGKRIITIQAFQDAILTYDPLNPSASQVERANIGSDYATAFPKATR